jgi:tetratricopeptide (TPR) repeat protein
MSGVANIWCVSYNLSVVFPKSSRLSRAVVLHFRIPILAILAFAFAMRAYPSQNVAPGKDHQILEIQRQIENHDLAEANRLLAEAAKRFPADPGLDNLRGVIAAQQGNYAAAQKNFEDAVRRAPEFTAAYLNLGRLYQENLGADPKARRKALNVYQRVLTYEGSNAEALYQSAVLFLDEGQYQRSLDHLLRLPPQTQAAAQSLSILCADHAALGHHQPADNAVTRLLDSPDFSELDAQQSLAGLVIGKRDDLIISLLEKLERGQSLSPASLHALGLAYERAGKLAESRATLEKFATGENLSVSTLLELARVAHKQRDFRGSLGYLAHARDLEPSNASLHYDFGLVCLDLNLVAEARNSFRKAVTLDPENASYNYGMGATSAFGQDPGEAVPYFKKYLAFRPDDPRGPLALGAVYFRGKDYLSAVPWLTQAAGKAETAAQAHYYLGSIALQEQRLEAAHSELDLALKANPDYTDALAQLGNYYLLRKEYASAEKQIRRALQLDPEHYSANFYLLTLYTRTGDARREAQAKRFEKLKVLLAERSQELLRIVEVRPFETP